MTYTIPRSDHRLSAIVDDGIRMANAGDYAGAYAHMRDLGVPLKVILRVLCNETARRPTC